MKTRLLVGGFDYLTLDPSPRSRAMRTRLQRRNFFLEAQQLVSQAMTESFADIGGEVSAAPQRQGNNYDGDGLNLTPPERETACL